MFNPFGLANFRLGSDPEKLFPFSMFQRHLQKFARICLILVTFLVSKMFSDSSKNWDELAENFERNQQVPTHLYNQTDSTIEVIHKRLRDIVIDMIRLEYI